MDALPTVVDLAVTDVKDELNQDIWDGMKLRPEVREQLLRIAQEFVDWLEVDVPVLDVLFTGSLANLNWSQFSDIDLHPLIDYYAVDEDFELVKDLMRAKKTVWNERFDMRTYGFEVELYAQHYDEPHHSTGVYSVLNDEWLVQSFVVDPGVDVREVAERAEAMMDLIDSALSDEGCSDECLSRVKDRIKRMRRTGLEKGGEFSVENLAFKALRRSGHLERLYDIADRRLEKELTLAGPSKGGHVTHQSEARTPTGSRTYVHFTDRRGARSIVKTGTIEASSIFVEPTVFAVVAGGAYVPGVQRTRLGRAQDRDWAVVFETDVRPDAAYPEEVMWRTEELPVRDPRVVPADEALILLDDTLERTPDDMLQLEGVDFDDLEAYRSEVLQSVRSLGSFYMDEAERLLGVPVSSVWVHGSVLDSNEFSVHSDVDVAVVVDVPGDRGIDPELSEALTGVLPDGISGVVDVIVLNGEQPVGREVKPIRIA